MTITEQVKQAATETTAPQDNARYLCRHVHADGRRCGSRALRRQNFCYYHTANRPPVQNPRLRKQERNEFDLSDPTDRTSLQLTLGEVLRLIVSNQIDPRRAGLLLYGLQIASGNIPKPKSDERPRTVEEVVDDPELGLIAPEEEAVPWGWSGKEWREKHEREALHLEINQKLVQECDARIIELERQHKKELSQQLADLKHEVHCLRSVRDPNPAMKSWGEKSLEELRVKRENAAKQLVESPANSSGTPPVASNDELDTKHLDSESEEEDDGNYPIIPYINGSASSSETLNGAAHDRRRSQSARVKLFARQRSQSQPSRKSAAKRRRRGNAPASRLRAAKMECAAVSSS